MLRSRHTVPVLVIAVIVGGICVATALLIDWIPEQASEQSERVDMLMWFVVWSSIAIFTLVATVLIYSAWKFRAPPGDESDGPPIHGNTKLEIVWTIVPTVLLAVMAVWAYLVLSDNEALASDRLIVNVTAEQFAWSYQYPDGDIGTGDLRVPGRPPGRAAHALRGRDPRLLRRASSGSRRTSCRASRRSSSSTRRASAPTRSSAPSSAASGTASCAAG